MLSIQNAALKLSRNELLVQIGSFSDKCGPLKGYFFHEIYLFVCYSLNCVPEGDYLT